MKLVILAGGLGSRLSEETELKPKPMVEIGGRPIIWHIMKIYSMYGIREFVICCGYKGYLIKEYFANYFLHTSDVTFDLENGRGDTLRTSSEGWKVTLVDTGENSMTGGRLKRVEKFVDMDQEFCFTYGDGLANIDIAALLRFHRSHGGQATLTAVKPPSRYGVLDLSDDRVNCFREKPVDEASWINGGFFVLSPKIFNRISDDSTVWEASPLRSLATDGQLFAYKHFDFWQPMDTLREKNLLNQLWANGKAPWKIW